MENVAEKVLALKYKTEKFAQKSCRKCCGICLREMEVEKKPNRTRKVFVVKLRDKETQNAEVITAVSSNGWFYLS